MSTLSIAYLKEGQRVNADLTGRLVSLSALRLTSELQNRIDPWDRLILDMTKVTEVDTTGVNAILSTQMKCTHKNASMVIKCQKNHPLNALLKLTQTASYLDVVESGAEE